MVPVVLKNSDVGAPQSNATAGSFRAILKWALPQLGWTEEFDDASAQKVVFRNSPVDGLGFYIQLTDNSSSSSDYGARLVGYKSMSAIDTGTDPFGQDLFTMRITSLAENDAWYIVGDNRTFYWIRQVRQAFTHPHFSIWMTGEIRPFSAIDTNHFVVSGITSTTMNFNGLFGNLVWGTPSTSVVGGKAPYSIDGITSDVIILSDFETNRFFTNNSPSRMTSHDGEFVISDLACREDFTLRGGFRGVYNSSSYLGDVAAGITTVNTPSGSKEMLRVPTYQYPLRSFDSDTNKSTHFFSLEPWG